MSAVEALAARWDGIARNLELTGEWSAAWAARMAADEIRGLATPAAPSTETEEAGA